MSAEILPHCHSGIFFLVVSGLSVSF